MQDKLGVFVLPASPGGKAAPVRHTNRGDPRASDLATLLLKNMAKAPDAQVTTELKKRIKDIIKAQDAANPFGGMGTSSTKKKRKKKRRFTAKEEL